MLLALLGTGDTSTPLPVPALTGLKNADGRSIFFFDGSILREGGGGGIWLMISFPSRSVKPTVRISCERGKDSMENIRRGWMGGGGLL